MSVSVWKIPPTMMNGGKAEWGSGKNEEGEKEKKVAVEEDGKLGDRWDVF